MAYLIECDRCGNTEKVKSAGKTPENWLEFSSLWGGEGIAKAALIEGGVFCGGCARELEKWRRPIPRAKLMDPEDFRKFACPTLTHTEHGEA